MCAYYCLCVTIVTNFVKNLLIFGILLYIFDNPILRSFQQKYRDYRPIYAGTTIKNLFYVGSEWKFHQIEVLMPSWYCFQRAFAAKFGNISPGVATFGDSLAYVCICKCIYKQSTAHYAIKHRFPLKHHNKVQLYQAWPVCWRVSFCGGYISERKISGVECALAGKSANGGGVLSREIPFPFDKDINLWSSLPHCSLCTNNTQHSLEAMYSSEVKAISFYRYELLVYTFQ